MIGALNATRPWQHVIEILNGYLKLAKELKQNKKINGNSFNFGPRNNEIVSVGNILRYIKDSWPGFDWVKMGNPIKNETDQLVLDTSKAQKILNWKTRFKVKESVKLTIDWYREFYKKRNTNSLIIEFTRKQIINYHNKFNI